MLKGIAIFTAGAATATIVIGKIVTKVGSEETAKSFGYDISEKIVSKFQRTLFAIAAMKKQGEMLKFLVGVAVGALARDTLVQMYRRNDFMYKDRIEYALSVLKYGVEEN